MSIEKSYDELCEEMNGKIDQAIELLKEARTLATQAGVDLPSYDNWDDLRNIFDGITLPAPRAWDSSGCSYGSDTGWDSSGCSF